MQRIRNALVGLAVAAVFLTPVAASAQPSAAPLSSASDGQLEPARDKSMSPPTDVLRYPKQETAPEAELEQHTEAHGRATGRRESKEVLAKQALPDGATRYTLYTPGKGVAPEQLAAKLRRTGVNAEVVTHDASGDDVSTLAGACGIGIARTLTCPPTFWKNNGHHDPQVYFVDHSSWRWPTDQAVYTWHQSYGIDSYYAWGNCPGYAGTHCVHVWSGNYGAGWSGWTSYVREPDSSFRSGSTVVYLNDYYASQYPSTGWRTVVCHELGHALGLGHTVPEGATSCMGTKFTSIYPHNDDFALLGDIYSIYR